jgi:FG-GAP-like repeat
MKRWALFRLAILAISLTDVGARAEIPAFVRPGLVVTYSGQSNPDQGDSSVHSRSNLTPSSQRITIGTVNRANPNLTTGTTVIDDFTTPPSETWVCREGQQCVITPSTTGAIAHFWVDPNDPTSSISLPSGEHWSIETPCPAEVTISNLTCISSYDFIHKNSSNAVLYDPSLDICRACRILAFDTTGLVRFFWQDFDPSQTFNGKGDGFFIYTFQSMLPPQSDGTSIFLQDVSGQPMMWEIDGTTVTDGPSLAKPGSGWYIAGIGDFNGDGNSDILWRNGAANQIWELNKTGRINKGQNSITDNYTGAILKPPSDWKVVGTGDFNRDGKFDILWQKNTGEIEIWEMMGTVRIGHGRISNPDPGWRAVGTGDFNLDGMADILWQNANGEVAISEMNGTTVTNTYNIAFNNPGNLWKAVGAGNFDGTGKADILFQNRGNGQVWICKKDATKLTPIKNANGSIPNPGPSWQVVGVSDYHNNNHTADIVFQNVSGAVTAWRVNGTSMNPYAIISGPTNPILYVMGVGQ